MCGIVGYVGSRRAADLLVAGLRKLEYRGYDSAGIAVRGDDGKVTVVRCQGKLDNLVKLLGDHPPEGSTGIGHTRWATHGRPSDENAHPHRYEGVAVVHNGIIENHIELREGLRQRGHAFSSETDTEIFAHLIADAEREGVAGKAGDGLLGAVRRALTLVRGTYSLAVVSERAPGEIIATKNASPLVLGFGKGEQFVASDLPALLAETRDVVFMEEGEIARLTAARIELFGFDGVPRDREPRRVDWSPLQAEKGGHKHFMHKEIHEQPQAVADTLRGRVLHLEGDVDLALPITAAEAKALPKVIMLACGTSHHAALIGKIYMESLAQLPTEVVLGSEFRHGDPLVPPGALAIAVSQSGETLDTLGALKEAKARGARSLAICNVVDSAITREAEGTLYTHAGPEIGVASTKCFTTQLAALFLLAIRLGRLRGTLDVARGQQLLNDLLRIPHQLEELLRREPDITNIARRTHQARDFLFLGRGPQFPVALEGALKLKEISYIHAEGYAAGEMKHGPIALIDDGLPVVVLATPGPGYEKIVGNIEEVRARGGFVISVCQEDDALGVPSISNEVIRLPEAPTLLLPMLSVLPLQLLAYHIADQRGTDVDQPRNLAKSVTVE